MAGIKIIFSAYTLALLLIYQLGYFTPSVNPAWDYGVVASIALALVLMLMEIFEKKREKTRLPGREIVVVSVLILLIAAVRAPLVTRFSLWGDELTQFFFDFRHDSLFNHSAREQQLVVGYLYSFFAKIALGSNYVAVRAHTFVFGLGSAALFYLWLRRAKAPQWIAALTTLLFAFQPQIYFQGIEARSIPCGLFLALVVLHDYWEALEEDSARPGLRRSLSRFGLLWIFLLSVGYQPPIFLFALTVVALFRIKTSRSVRIYAGLMILSVLLFLPVALKVIEVSHPFFAKTFSWEILRKVCREMLNPDTFQHFPMSAMPNGKMLLALVLFVLGGGPSRIQRYLRGARLAYTTALAYFIFCLIDVSYFKANINWILVTRYLALGIPLYFASLGLHLTFLFQEIGLLTRQVWRRALGLTLLVGVGLFAWKLEIPSHGNFTRYFYREDYREIFSRIEEEARDPVSDKFLSFCPAVDNACWDLDLISKMAREFYPELKLNYSSRSYSELLRALSAQHKPRRIFLVVNDAQLISVTHSRSIDEKLWQDLAVTAYRANDLSLLIFSGPEPFRDLRVFGDRFQRFYPLKAQDLQFDALRLIEKAAAGEKISWERALDSPAKNYVLENDLRSIF